MNRYYNRKTELEVRRKLRNESPPAEVALWRSLRRGQILGAVHGFVGSTA